MSQWRGRVPCCVKWKASCATRKNLFLLSLSLFVLLFHVTVEAPFLLLPSSSHFIFIVGHTVFIVSFCCAWGKLGCSVKLSGSFNLTLYNVGTLSVVHIVLAWAVCDRAALFEEKFGLAGVGVGEFCFGNHGYVCQHLVLLKLKCFLLLAPFLWLFLSPFSPLHVVMSSPNVIQQSLELHLVPEFFWQMSNPCIE